MRIEPLSAHHDRANFDCGVESLNGYLKRYARQNADRDLGVTYVAVEGESACINGYYTVASSTIARASVPETALPRYPVPAFLIARLAVDKESQGKRLGEMLLFDALRRAVRVSQELGLYAVEVVALSEPAKAFYLRYGFSPLTDDNLHRYLSLKTLRTLGL